MAVPLPVQFDTDKASLTKDGELAVSDILEFVTQEQPRGLKIIGHTDERGAEAYNLDLSRRRAKTVADALTARGYKGQIEIVAKGETTPFEPDDPLKYSKEERFKFDRRVEYELVN